MSTDQSPLLGGFSGRLLGSAATLIGMAVLMFLFLVRPNEPRTNIETDEARDRNTTQTSTVEDRCERELARILRGMEPGRLGITSERVAMVDELNRWKLNCQPTAAVESISSDGELLATVLSGELLPRANSERFLPEDASHIRESLLSRQIVEHVTREARTDVDRVVALFDFVVRNIALLPADASEQTPLSPYESLLFGVGTAEDRAWVYGSLLRQIRIDGVVLQPRAEGKQDEWLVAAILERDGILLFDPRLGLPIPFAGTGTETTPFPRQPATLSEVRESDASLRQLDLPDSPYPLTSEDLRDLNVRLIGSSSLWASRMAELQFLLPQEVSVDLYDGLGPNALREPGLWERVAAAGGNELWTEERLAIWQFPERQLARIDAARGVEGTPLAGLFHVFGGPYVPRHDPRTDQIYAGTTERTLHAVRVEQLQGDHVQALKHFLPIRTSFQLAPLAENQIAADYAAIWTAISQFETGKRQPALATFERYAASHGDGSGFARSALEWAARCHLATGGYEQAARLLAAAPPSPAPRRDAYLIRRWQKLAAGDKADAPSESPKSEGNATPEDLDS